MKNRINENINFNHSTQHNYECILRLDIWTREKINAYN